jgi:Kunitz/Bovine pancreatic trypsin inhibitor domain
VITDQCLLPKDDGDGSLQVSRFYFDSKTSACKEFSFGGEGGNENNFDSLFVCHQVCEI